MRKNMNRVYVPKCEDKQGVDPVLRDQGWNGRVGTSWNVTHWKDNDKDHTDS